MRRLAPWTYLAATAAWAAWLVVAPAWLSARAMSPARAFAIAATYRAGGLVCHQDPLRSFAIGRVPLPVCARCTGLYGGAVAGAAFGCVWARRRRQAAAARGNGLELSTVRQVIVLSALPTAGLWAAEWVAGVTVGNVVRFAGALPLGAAVSWVIVLALDGGHIADNLRPAGVH